MGILTGVLTAVGLLKQAGPLVGLIKGLIQGAEDTVGSGNGQEKKNMVVDSVRPFVKKLKDKGLWPDEIDDSDVADVIELIFGMMQGGRELKENKRDKPSKDGSFALKEGVAMPVVLEGQFKGAIKPNTGQ